MSYGAIDNQNFLHFSMKDLFTSPFKDRFLLKGEKKGWIGKKLLFILPQYFHISSSVYPPSAVNYSGFNLHFSIDMIVLKVIKDP